MAKTAAPKKGKHPISIHSRASKRASSPSINTDKSLKTIQPPTFPVRHSTGGVSKPSASKRVLSSRARRRAEKGMDRAEAVLDQKAARVAKSRGRARTVQERARAWEELNRQIAVRQAEAERERREAAGEVWGDDNDEGGEGVQEEVDIEVLVLPSLEGMEIGGRRAVVEDGEEEGLGFGKGVGAGGEGGKPEVVVEKEDSDEEL